MEDRYSNLISLGPPVRVNEEGVEYVVLGGHAVIAHGYLRTTAVIRNKQATGRPQDLQDLANLPTPD